jgi:hypothetical protein
MSKQKKEKEEKGEEEDKLNALDALDAFVARNEQYTLGDFIWRIIKSILGVEQTLVLSEEISKTKFQKLVSELCQHIDRSPQKITVFCDWIQKSSTQLNLIVSHEQKQHLFDYLLRTLIDRLDDSLLQKKETAINDVLIALLKAYKDSNSQAYKDSNSQIELSQIANFRLYKFTMVFSKIASSTNFATYYGALEFLLDINQNRKSNMVYSERMENLCHALLEIITKFTEEQVDALVDLLNRYDLNDVNNKISYNDSPSRRLFQSLAKLIDSRDFDSEYSKLKKLLMLFLDKGANCNDVLRFMINELFHYKKAHILDKIEDMILLLINKYRPEDLQLRKRFSNHLIDITKSFLHESFLHDYFRNEYENFESYVLFVKFLIKYGADVNWKDENGNTIFHLFFRNEYMLEEDRLEFIIFLYEHCLVDDSIKNHQGYTAFDTLRTTYLALRYDDAIIEKMIRYITYCKRRNYMLLYESFETTPAEQGNGYLANLLFNYDYCHEICSFI